MTFSKKKTKTENPLVQKIDQGGFEKGDRMNCTICHDQISEEEKPLQWVICSKCVQILLSIERDKAIEQIRAVLESGKPYNPEKFNAIMGFYSITKEDIQTKKEVIDNAGRTDYRRRNYESLRNNTRTAGRPETERIKRYESRQRQMGLFAGRRD